MNNHDCNWQLASVNCGHAIYSTAVGTSVHRYETGREPDVARFVCECGASKDVELTPPTKQESE